METITEYRKRLRELGIKRLGGGLFSSVYQHPTLPNVAVKMIVRNDPKYIEYAQKCTGLDNPWLPKIYGIEYAKVLKRGREITVAFVFLERLKRASRKERINTALKLGASKETNAGNGYLECLNWKALQRSKDKNVSEAAKLLCDIGMNDLHEGNVMMRDGQLVITDPVASEIT